MKCSSYQQGTVTFKPRRRAPDLWVLRYEEGGAYRSMEIGNVNKFKSKGAARKEADKKLLEISERLAGITVSGLCDRLRLEWDKADVDLAHTRLGPTNPSYRCVSSSNTSRSSSVQNQSKA